MSQGPPQDPPPGSWPPPAQWPQRPPGPPARPPGGGSIVLGLVVGILVLGGLGWLTFYTAATSIPVVSVVAPWLIPAYLVAAVTLALIRTTTRFGSGLLIAIGAWFVIGAGLCVALIAGVGR